MNVLFHDVVQADVETSKINVKLPLVFQNKIQRIYTSPIFSKHYFFKIRTQKLIFEVTPMAICVAVVTLLMLI